MTTPNHALVDGEEGPFGNSEAETIHRSEEEENVSATEHCVIIDKVIAANSINYGPPNSVGTVIFILIAENNTAITNVDPHILTDEALTFIGETVKAEGILTDPCILYIAGECTNDVP